MLSELSVIFKTMDNIELQLLTWGQSRVFIRSFEAVRQIQKNGYICIMFNFF